MYFLIELLLVTSSSFSDVVSFKIGVILRPIVVSSFKFSSLPALGIWVTSIVASPEASTKSESLILNSRYPGSNTTESFPLIPFLINIT